MFYPVIYSRISIWHDLYLQSRSLSGYVYYLYLEEYLTQPLVNSTGCCIPVQSYRLYLMLGIIHWIVSFPDCLMLVLHNDPKHRFKNHYWFLVSREIHRLLLELQSEGALTADQSLRVKEWLLSVEEERSALTTASGPDSGIENSSSEDSVTLKRGRTSLRNPVWLIHALKSCKIFQSNFRCPALICLWMCCEKQNVGSRSCRAKLDQWKNWERWREREQYCPASSTDPAVGKRKHRLSGCSRRCYGAIQAAGEMQWKCNIFY